MFQLFYQPPDKKTDHKKTFIVARQFFQVKNVQSEKQKSSASLYFQLIKYLQKKVLKMWVMTEERWRNLGWVCFPFTNSYAYPLIAGMIPIYSLLWNICLSFMEYQPLKAI